jgi:hypothetical protein
VRSGGVGEGGVIAIDGTRLAGNVSQERDAGLPRARRRVLGLGRLEQLAPAHGAWGAPRRRLGRERPTQPPGCAPARTRPRDLRSSYVTLRVYEGVPFTQVAREVGTSVRMIEQHYAGVIANWDGKQVAAKTYIRAARQTFMEVDVSRVEHRLPAAGAGIVSVKGAAGPAGARRAVRLLCADRWPQDRVSL